MRSFEQRLNDMREVEGVTGPFMCLASAKFMAGKLAGLFDGAKHLYDFTHSPWSRNNGEISAINAAWGHCDKAAITDFNDRVLKASVEENDGKVRATNQPTTHPVEFVYFTDVGTADRLLKRRVPIVAGATFSGGRRDHFVTMVADSDGAVWAVDPWDGSPGVVKAEEGMTFTSKIEVSSSIGHITVPCANPFFGIYRTADDQTPLKTKGM